MTQPKRDPFLPEDKQPLMVCKTCHHFKMPVNREGYQEWVRGGCSLMGYSTIPPHHTCALWTKRRKVRKEEEV